MRGACGISILLTCTFSLLKEMKSSAEHDNDDKVLNFLKGQAGTRHLGEWKRGWVREMQ